MEQLALFFNTTLALICTILYNSHNKSLPKASLPPRSRYFCGLGLASAVTPSATDTNPFRYCGEYLDFETKSYYLRARNYNPVTGRFLTEDTHWNPTNMIYGDNPIKWNEREQGKNDPLGLNVYTYFPDVTAIRQSGNLYVYGLNNPLMYYDPTGKVVANIIGAVLGAGGGALLGKMVADHYQLSGWKKTATIAGFTVGGAALGWFAGPLVEKLAMALATKMGLVSAGAAIGTQFGKLGTLIHDPKVVIDWSNTTIHGLQRMAERGVSQSMVEAWVKTGKALQQTEDKFLYIAKEGAVVVNKAGQVITAYGSKYFDATVQDAVQQLFGK